MKRIAAIIMATILICMLFACGKKPISADYVKNFETDMCENVKTDIFY